jgi:hypothetical protein
LIKKVGVQAVGWVFVLNKSIFHHQPELRPIVWIANRIDTALARKIFFGGHWDFPKAINPTRKSTGGYKDNDV